MPRARPAARLMVMNTHAHAAAGGLYSFKSWYAGRLAPVRRRLVAAQVPPAAITVTGIAFGAGGGRGGHRAAGGQARLRQPGRRGGQGGWSDDRLRFGPERGRRPRRRTR